MPNLAVATPQDTSTETPINTPSTTPTTAMSTELSSDVQIFHIIQEESQVRFSIDEMLFGSPKTVIGRTNAITGTVAINMSDFADTQIRPIQIDARSLQTDDAFRNRAMRLQILQSSRDEYRFITFVTEEIIDLPTHVTVSEPFEIEAIGALTVRDVTNPISFTLIVMPHSETHLTIAGTASIVRGDFGLTIPKVPGIANVSDEVLLSFDITLETYSH